jgi:hypothetical protein
MVKFPHVKIAGPDHDDNWTWEVLDTNRTPHVLIRYGFNTTLQQACKEADEVAFQEYEAMKKDLPRQRFIDNALKIEELEYKMQNWAADEPRDIRSFTVEEILMLAEEVVAEIKEEGHVLYEAYHMGLPEEKADLRKQLRQLNRLIKELNNDASK